MDTIVSRARDFAVSYMGQYDGSHDFQHVERVLGLAKIIEESECRTHPEILIDCNVVTLSCLLLDVGDRKYLQAGEDGATKAEELLLSFGAEQQLAQTVQLIINNVSYSRETLDPIKVQNVLARHPELGIVQDADRLDAIGAIGIGRTFTYNAAKGAKDMQVPFAHFGEKLLKLKNIMKTDMGKEMADVRTQRLEAFSEWWIEESAVSKSSQ
jgi:uncharacterized protein